MNFWLSFRLKLKDFFIKYGLIIFIVIVVIAIILTINFAMKRNKVNKIVKENSINNIETHISNTKEEIPKKYEEQINELINNYFNYCNNKEYENAYALLSEDFKNLYFKNINTFKTYINKLFKTKRTYSIQSYSNINNTYIYNVHIMEDILATGTTNSYEYLEDKFVIKEESGELKLSLNGYCGQEQLNIIVEDDYMKIKIVSKRITYENEIYVIQFTNKTDNHIILANGKETSEICLSIQGQIRTADTSDSNIIILPNETATKTVSFDKYFDDGKQSTKLILNAIRILPEYTGYDENVASELKKAIKLYSLNINLKPDEE